MAGTAEERLRKLISKVLKVDEAAITPESHFVRDLGMESVQSIELIAAIEEEFDVEIDEDEVANVLTFGKSLAYVQKKLEEA
jgi:acyl carrier protein